MLRFPCFLRLTLLLAFLAAPAGAQREYVVQWMPSADAGGYTLHVGDASGSYASTLDFGAVAPDADGVCRRPIYVDETQDQYLAMSAYNDAGRSPLSNEIVVAAASVCDPTGCDDANACTVDDCSGPSCIHTPLPDGTLCGADGSICLAGSCQAVECLADLDCADGDACNGAEVCSQGSCQPGTPPSCGEPTACSIPSCDPLLGCVSFPVADGTACDDGLDHTFGDVCQEGSCVGYDLFLSVDEISPRLLAPGPTRLTVSGSGFAEGAQVSFTGGRGSAPKVQSVERTGPDTLSVLVDVNPGGKRDRTSVFDAVVTNPDGSSASLPESVLVVR